MGSRDANAVAAAVLADLPPGKGVEEEIESELGSGACKVWKELKLLLQPQGKCEKKEHAGKEEGEEEFVCEEADCLLLWLEDKTFSVSARTALMAWSLLLARSDFVFVFVLVFVFVFVFVLMAWSLLLAR